MEKKQTSLTREDNGNTLLSAYSVDTTLALKRYEVDEYAIPFLNNGVRAEYHPRTISLYALAHWNAYLTTHSERHRRIFLAQAQWLVQHETQINEDASGWLHTFSPLYMYSGSSWLSATTQSCALSILLRAYQLTQEACYLTLANRVVRTFELDILDGGIGAPVGDTGIFFEEVAVYPATHNLLGCLFALIGLFDYKTIVKTQRVDQLIERSIEALQLYIDAYDTGHWTCTDLLEYNLASPAELALHINVLDVVARLTHSSLCATLVTRWQRYAKRPGERFYYEINSRLRNASRKLISSMRRTVFSTQEPSRVTRVCIALTAFPVTGGIRAVMAGIARATEHVWNIEYVTHSIGPNPQRLPIHVFGARWMSSWQFPNVWFYIASGFCKTLSLLRHGSQYDVLLPQDGIYTSLFTALVGRLTGVRVVCIDHGNLTLLGNAAYRTERIQQMAKEHRSKIGLHLSLLRYRFYFPSLSLFASIAVHLVDHFLIPGVAGDSVEESCKRLGIHPSRITRFGSMIDIERHIVPDALSRGVLRAQKSIPPDAVLVAMVCRLAPEKGIDTALEAIDLACRVLSPVQRSLLRVVIAGAGPLQTAIEEDIVKRGLSTTCLLWGEIPSQEVLSLLGISDIFLYTSRRGACFSMAALEAMASQCAVIASTEPLSNAHLLSNGRGIALSANDAQGMADALVRLVGDKELCAQMGRQARDYITVQHSVAMFRRTLLRVTRWTALDEIVEKQEADISQSYEVV